jgi:protein TonB
VVPVKLTQLKMLYKPDANVFYPRISKDIGEQGVVGVTLFIDEAGSVYKTQVTNLVATNA